MKWRKIINLTVITNGVITNNPDINCLKTDCFFSQSAFSGCILGNERNCMTSDWLGDISLSFSLRGLGLIHSWMSDKVFRAAIQIFRKLTVWRMYWNPTEWMPLWIIWTISWLAGFACITFRYCCHCIESVHIFKCFSIVPLFHCFDFYWVWAIWRMLLYWTQLTQTVKNTVSYIILMCIQIRSDTPLLSLSANIWLSLSYYINFFPSPFHTSFIDHTQWINRTKWKQTNEKVEKSISNKRARNN